MKINNLQSILTQNHLSTESPIYIVYSKQETCVDGDYEYDKMIFIKSGDDYPELSPKEFEKLESEWEMATSFDTKDEYPIPKDPFDEESDFDPDDWEPRYVKYIDRFEQAFFIRENAENFLASQRHNIGEKAYIYVESAYRNPEWQQIRELLINEAKKNENTFGELKFGLKYEDIVDGMFVVYSELPFSNYANSLKRIWKTEIGWKEQTLTVEWKGLYQESDNIWDCGHRWIWDSKCYSPTNYDGQTPPVEFMNKVLPLTTKGTQDT